MNLIHNLIYWVKYNPIRMRRLVNRRINALIAGRR